MKLSRHHLILAAILLLGAALRFWQLALKPIWLDEVITALFSLGHTYKDVPMDATFSLSALETVFALKPETTCAQIAQTVTIESVHPPLFFCWMHRWLVWLEPLSLSWLWKLRALPALVGVLAIAAIYQFNRLAFSRAAGLAGALVMAVSPFAVYLSQEARHYTLPMLLIVLALLGLYQVQTDLYRRQFHPSLWFGWIIINGLGFYIHYFFLLAFAAQVMTLVINVLTFKTLPTIHLDRRDRAPLYSLHPRRALTAIALASGGVCLTYLPWLPTFLAHVQRPETDWMKPFEPDWLDAIAPLYQLPAGWILMIIALPVENQPFWVAVLMGLVMLLFTGWLLWQVSGRLWQLWCTPETHLPTRMLVVFILSVLLEFLLIIGVLHKDLTTVPRYNFIYFPAVCALLGACLVQKPPLRSVTLIEEEDTVAATVPANLTAAYRLRPHSPSPLLRYPVRQSTLVGAVLVAGLLSSLLVVNNYVFLKPYQPNRFAQTIATTTKPPVLLGMAYSNLQDVALGLSFALAVQPTATPQPHRVSDRYMVFLPGLQTYAQVWQTLAQLQQPLSTPINFWMIAPGLKQTDFPHQLTLMDSTNRLANCQLVKEHAHRVGVPYQLYSCPASTNSAWQDGGNTARDRA